MSARRLFRASIRVLGTFLLTLILLLTVITAGGIILKNERGLSPWGTGFFIIATGSMEPTLPVGSLILVRSVSAETIKENDIITYYAANGVDVVTHRVRKVDVSDSRYVFTTKGDANNADDLPLNSDRVIGRLLLSVPGANLLKTVFSNIHYLGIIIIVVGVILCIASMSGSKRKNKNKKTKKTN